MSLRAFQRRRGLVFSRSVVVAAAAGRRRGLLHLHQELDVALGLLEPLEQQLECLLTVETGENPAELPDDRKLLLAHQQLLATGTGLPRVDGREQPLVGEVSAQPDLHVAGPLDLLEDPLPHLRATLDQRGCQDRQRAAVLDVASRTEEALRRGQRRGGPTTGPGAAARPPGG